jgi:hypothetical protein
MCQQTELLRFCMNCIENRVLIRNNPIVRLKTVK